MGRVTDTGRRRRRGTMHQNLQDLRLTAVPKGGARAEEAISAVYGRAGSTSTRMLRHFPWRNRRTLSAQRVIWPSKIAVQMSAGCNSRVAWINAHRLSGTTIWDTIEM